MDKGIDGIFYHIMYQIKLILNYKFEKFYFIILFILLFSSLQAQKKIEFTSNSMEMNERIAPDAKRLLGNVVFKHEGTIMYCDSAYYYSERNALDAFSHVYINKGDTLHMYADIVKYDGNTKMTNARKHVKLIDNETTLYTDYLDYDMQKDIGHYIDWGKTISNNDTLFSDIGFYFANEDMFHFKDSVKVFSKDFTMFSDTLNYQTKTKMTYFFGPTHMYRDSGYMYCEYGWYNTITEISSISRNALISQPKQILKADSLYYEEKTGYGEGFCNVEMIDTLREVIIKGNMGIYHKEPEMIMMTDRAYMIQYSAETIDSLFLHGDTLRSVMDTNGFRILRAYHRVKVYRTNVQAICDSLVYTFADSTVRLYVDPVLWNETNQITADFIEIFTGNGETDSIKMHRNALNVEQVDSSYYNQIKGKSMTGYFQAGEMHKLKVYGESQSIYFPNDNGEIIGANKAQSLNMSVYMKDGEIDKIYLLVDPIATLYPLNQIQPEDLKMKGFLWLDELRPKKKDDIFTWQQRKVN